MITIYLCKDIEQRENIKAILKLRGITVPTLDDIVTEYVQEANYDELSSEFLTKLYLESLKYYFEKVENVWLIMYSISIFKSFINQYNYKIFKETGELLCDHYLDPLPF